MNPNTIYPCLGRQGQKMGQRTGEKELQQYSCTECIWWASVMLGELSIKEEEVQKDKTEVLVELL
jgi:hypothetical protein